MQEEAYLVISKIIIKPIIIAYNPVTSRSMHSLLLLQTLTRGVNLNSIASFCIIMLAAFDWPDHLFILCGVT